MHSSMCFALVEGVCVVLTYVWRIDHIQQRSKRY